MAENFKAYADSRLAEAMKENALAEPAFTEIYRRYSKKIYLYCLKICQSEYIAGDAFQDTWLKFHQAAVKPDADIYNLLGFLIRIARNSCLNATRNKDIFTDIDAIDPGYTDNSVENTEIMSLVDQAVERLNGSGKELFILHDIEGLSYEEIASLTGNSAAAIRNKVWRARKKVRDFLSLLMNEQDF